MVILPVLALMPCLLLEHRRHRHLTNPGLYLGLGLGFLPAATWLGLSMARYGSLPLTQLFGKVLSLSRSDGAFETSATPLFYRWNIPANSFPWALFAIAGAILIWHAPGLGHKGLWLGYPLLFLLLLAFRTRTWYYPLQLYPFVGAAVGQPARSQPRSTNGPGLAVAGGLATGAVAGDRGSVSYGFVGQLCCRHQNSAAAAPCCARARAKHRPFLQPDANAEAVLLTAYTPSLGRRLPDLAALGPGEYAWVEVSDQPLPRQYSIISTVRNWQLVGFAAQEPVTGRNSPAG